MFIVTDLVSLIVYELFMRSVEGGGGRVSASNHVDRDQTSSLGIRHYRTVTLERFESIDKFSCAF